MREQLRHKMREMVATLGKGEALLDSGVKKKIRICWNSCLRICRIQRLPLENH